MILLLPLLLSLVFYLLKEYYGLIILGISYLLLSLIDILIKSENLTTGLEGGNISIELLVLILISLLVIYWLEISNNIKFNNFMFGSKELKGDNAYEILGSIFIIGSYLSLMSTSIVSLFISIEILTFTTMILINLYIQDQYPGILYYLFSGLFSAFFILSLALIYMGSNLALKFLFIVFMAKIGLAPFHILLPILYQNLSIEWIFLIDIPYKIILFMVINKLNIINSFNIGSIDIGWIIILSILIGAIGSLRYKNLLSIGIYSSIYHYALILITIENNNLDYFFYYITIYSIIILIYLSLITLYYQNFKINEPYYMTLWFILIMNLIGIPPLSGFFIKYYPLYLSLINLNWITFIIASFGLLLLTYTYLRILIIILLGKVNKENLNKSDLKKECEEVGFEKNTTENRFYPNLISNLIILISFLPLLIL
uniref:NADH dehydrogenase subunit 2 n=1 Tax=Amoeboaphelidium protococcarum TaxID=1243177 RepID=UPI0022381AEB|nr:NADH dehydrogenase subunit 2 [Amoeboaphelidium protococcarum]UYP50884.1 NADH dehydrogenase subunit 2 [Amoeboaphelidium protococcarum]UYP50906.1 NADH dehydrogenase subunit 2 [Amoeboaphelidium protococcarum]